jgi:spore coat protein JC
MWIYEKRLQYPVNIKETNAALAQAIMSQIGGPHESSNRWQYS